MPAVRAPLRLRGRTLTEAELLTVLMANWWWGRKSRRPVDLRVQFREA